MLRIVYGVSGEGSGHASRARVVLEHLTRAGHAVRVVTYDRGVRHLGSDFDLFETAGLHISSANNRVAPLKTLLANLQQLPDGQRKIQRLRHDIFKRFQPQVVITDFEPMCAYLANHYDLPLITIDNQHRLRYLAFEYPAPLKSECRLAVGIIRAMVSKPDVCLVTTFYFGEVLNQRTFLFPPLLRSKVQNLTTARGDHILVYLTSGFESFVALLKEFPGEHFIVYGHNGSGTQWTAHKKNTRRSKKREANAKSSLPILRRLLPEEAVAVRQVYKREIPDGSLVYQVCGGFRENSLVSTDTSGKRDCHYWIGAIEVEFDAQWYEFLQPENTAEVVWQDINSSDKACILKLNEGLDITRFQNQDLATAPDDPGQTASAQIRTLGTRPVTPAEKQYLDQRLWNFGFTGSLIIAASVIHLFRGGATFLTILTALGLFWVGSWLWRRRSSAEATEVTAFEGVFDQKQPKLIDQYGQARKQSSYNSIGRLHTDMPAQWLAYFKPGQHCRVAALLEKSQRYFPKALLVEAAPGLSVDKEIKRFGPRLQVEHHVTLCTVLAVVLLILFNVVDHPGAKAKRIGRALLGRDQPMEYADLADLLENPPDFDDHIVVHVARTVGILSKSHTQWIGLKPHEVFETRLEGEYIGDRLPYEPIDLKWEQKQARKLAGEIECINASDSPARLGESICNNPVRPAD